MAPGKLGNRSLSCQGGLQPSQGGTEFQLQCSMLSDVSSSAQGLCVPRQAAAVQSYEGGLNGTVQEAAGEVHSPPQLHEVGVAAETLMFAERELHHIVCRS